MSNVDNKMDSFPCLALTRSSVWKGVRDVVVVAPRGGAAAVRVLYSIHSPDVSTGNGAARRLDPDRGTTHRHPHIVDGAPAGRRGTSPTTTASSPAPAGPCGRWAGCWRRWCWNSSRRGRTGAVPGRRHGRAAPGQTRLRRGSPPRRVPLEQRSHGLALGTPLGHPGDQRAARLRQQPPVGASGADRVVPPARAERAGGTAAAAAQDADRAGAAAHRHADAPGSPRVRSSCWATAESRLTSWRSSVTAIAGG
jgi:hypothetical protein